MDKESNLLGIIVVIIGLFDNVLPHQHKVITPSNYDILSVTLWAPSQYKDHLIYVWRFPC